MFHNNLLYPDYKSQINDYMTYHNIRYVIMSNNYEKLHPMWKNVFLKLRWDFIKSKNVDVFKMPDVLYKKYKDISRKEAVSNFLFNEFSNLYKASRLLLIYENKIGNNPHNSLNNFLNHLNPEYLEKKGYLSKGYGYISTNKSNKTKLKHYTANRGGGYIGRWHCGVRFKCFAVGVRGTYGEVRKIINHYFKNAFKIYFPYPKIYINKENIKYKNKGRILIVFSVSTINKVGR